MIGSRFLRLLLVFMVVIASIMFINSDFFAIQDYEIKKRGWY